MTTISKSVLQVPEDNPNKRWYQCYLKDYFVAGGVRIQCDRIDQTYTYEQNSTLYQVPNYVPEFMTPFYLRCQMGAKVETVRQDNSRNSVKW